MTYEEVIKRFGNLELTFSSYYKYCFTYVGSRGSYRVSATVGETATTFTATRFVTTMWAQSTTYSPLKYGYTIRESLYSTGQITK